MNKDIYIYIICLGGLVVINSADGTKGPRFNSPVARDLILGPLHRQASSVWLCAVRLQQTVSV